MGHSLSQEVAIVIGAGRGITHAIALSLAARRRRSRRLRPDAGEIAETAELISEAGGRALALHLDVRDAAAVRATPSCPVSGSGWANARARPGLELQPRAICLCVAWRVELDLDRKLIKQPAPLS